MNTKKPNQADSLEMQFNRVSAKADTAYADFVRFLGRCAAEDYYDKLISNEEIGYDQSE